MVFVAPTLKLGGKTVSQKRRDLALPLRVITSPKLTAGLAGTLSILTGAGILTAGKVFLGTGFAGGLLESPVVRRFVKRKVLSPEKGGRAIGSLIEDPSKIVPAGGIFRGAGKITKEAGLVAGGLAVATGGVIAGREAIKRFRKGREKITTIPPVFTQPTLQPQMIPQQQPIGVVKQPEDKELKTKPLEAVMPTINNRINVSPIVNIRFSKSKKFINQQVLIRR